jgi:type IV pilus assembly protein PilY1
MRYAIPSTPSVLDLDFDGYADVVYVGDLGGQMWKWDITDVGVGSPVGNWEIGVVFRAPTVTLSDGSDHYRNIFFPPSASFSRGSLLLAFGTGERQVLRQLGDPGADDENRFYVMRDRFPTGPNRFTKVVYETDLTDITLLQRDNDNTDSGYYIRARESEKWVNEFTTFAGFVQAVSYVPTSADPCAAASGESFVYQFRASGGDGLYGGALIAHDDARRNNVGAGLASSPRVSMSMDPSMDRLYVKTSKGKVVTEQTPPRDGGNAAMIYWKQNF